YSRYLSRDTSRKSITVAVFLGAVGSPLWLIPLGAWMATRLRVSDALSGINVAGNATVAHAGTALALVAVGALVAAMGISAYSGMLSVLTIVDSFRPVRSGSRARLITVLGLAVVWFVLGALLTNATTVLNDWLLIMLYLLAPWTSVNLVDFYFVRRGKFATTDFFTPHGVYGRWGFRGITAYLVGIALEIPFMSIPNLYQSPGSTWLQGVDISWIIGLVVAGALYLVLSRSLDVAKESIAIERSQQKLRRDNVTR
ncbi:MAG TPA: cytosine permease, partial [Acidimicrobiales bacterium]